VPTTSAFSSCETFGTLLEFNQNESRVDCIDSYTPHLRSKPLLPPQTLLDRLRPELVLGLLIALVLPESHGVTIPHRPDVNLRR
jgi:hypothetical protein